MRGNNLLFSNPKAAAKEIRAFRERNNISQAKLAKAIGLSIQSISGYERCKAKPLPYLKLALMALEQELNRTK